MAVRASPYPLIVLTLTADFTVTNNAVLGNVPGMSVTLQPGNYTFSMGLNFNTNSAAIGYRWGFSTSGPPTYGNTGALVGIAFVSGSPALFNCSLATGTGNTQAAVTASDDLATVSGEFAVTVAGVLQLQFAQGTSSATASALSKGSSIVLIKVA